MFFLPHSLWRVIRAGVTGFAILVLLYLVFPTLAIIPLSFSSDSFLRFPPTGFSLRWYRSFFASPDYHMAILNTVKIGFCAASLATVLGVMAAIAVVRTDLPFRRVMSALFIAPLILPQIVLAIGLFPLMAKLSLLGTFPAIVMAHAVVTMPLVFLTVAAALRTVPRSYELAAMTLGSSPLSTFRHITLPLIAPGVVVGFVFSLTFSFDELILAMFLTSPTTRTLPRLLWEQLNFEMTPVIAAATTSLMAVTIGLLALAAIAVTAAKRHLGAPSTNLAG